MTFVVVVVDVSPRVRAAAFSLARRDTLPSPLLSVCINTFKHGEVLHLRRVHTRLLSTRVRVRGDREREARDGTRRRKEEGRSYTEGEREREGEGAHGSFAAGSNDPGCIDSWGCRAVVRVVVDGARGAWREKEVGESLFVSPSFSRQLEPTPSLCIPLSLSLSLSRTLSHVHARIHTDSLQSSSPLCPSLARLPLHLFGSPRY